MFDGIPTYKLWEKDGKIWVRVPKVIKGTGRKTMSMVKRDSSDSRRFVIVGGGAAALSAAETLRQSGYGGEIVLLTNEDALPYDRTILSKNIFGASINGLLSRSQSFLDEYEIKVQTGVNVNKVDPSSNTVCMEGKTPLKYDKLLIATGGSPRIPPIQGAQSNNVFVLRNYQQMEKIKAATQNAKNVVLIGASFISMECASNIKDHLKENVNVHVVDMASAPFERVLGADVGKGVQQIAEAAGVKFSLGSGIKAIEDNGSSKKVVLSNGQTLDADVVILGTGVSPNSEIVKGAVNLSKDGGIETNSHLQTSNNNIFAAGDVAAYPNWYSGDRTRVEHYSEAIQQGQVAAYNMLGKGVNHDAIPFFWTRQWGTSLQYVGNGQGYDNVWVDGDVAKKNFFAYYAKGEKILGVAAMGKSPATMVLNQAMQLDLLPNLSDLKNGKVSLDDIRKKVNEKKGKSNCRRHKCQHKKGQN
mmetsp:Transcript_34973/g.31521  ORF Transcript_34973/g.31521 Transcript_34973/m.31521 type:complete len:472 (+) Transcript_34973:471-1886(+)